MLDNLDADEKRLYALAFKYSTSFSVDELRDFENGIFGSVSEKYRVRSEFNRLRNACKNNINFYEKHLSQLVDVEKMLRISDFDNSVISRIADYIVKMQVDVQQPVRLYTAFPRIMKDLEYLNFRRSSSLKKRSR